MLLGCGPEESDVTAGPTSSLDATSTDGPTTDEPTTDGPTSPTEADTSTSSTSQSTTTSTTDADTSSTGDAECIPAPDGLVGWWRGEGNFLDEVAGSNGDELGGTQLTVDGYAGGGMQFDGIDDAVRIGSPPAVQLGLASFSVEAWARFDGLDNPPGSINPSSDMDIVSKMDRGAASNVDGWRLFKQTENHEIWFCLGRVDNGCTAGSSTTVATPPNMINVEEWVHVAAIKDGNTISLFVDGSLVDEAETANAVNTDAADLFIGATEADPGYERTGLFFGTIDEVAIYDRALDDAEVAALAGASAGKCAD